MITSHELLDLLRSLGVDLSDLVPLLAKKASAKGAARLVGSSKAVISNLVRRLQLWRDHRDLEAALESEVSPSAREAITQTFLERWIIAQQHEAAEAAKLLFRIVYLKALRGHCDDLPVVANLGFSPRTLNSIWVKQQFRTPFSSGRIGSPRGDEHRSSAFSLEHALSQWGPRVIVEGPAGSGKSTQMRKFVLDRIDTLFALDDFEQFLREPVPVYLNASDISDARQDFATSLELAVRSSLGLRLPYPMPAGFFDRRQRGAAGRILLIVDGLNEVGAQNLDRLLTILDQAIGESAESISSIVSAWPLERANGEVWRGFRRIEICEFDATQASNLATKLLGEESSKKFTAQQSRLPRSPMLLTLAALLQSGAASSVEASLYQEFILALLKKRSDEGLLSDDPPSYLRLLSSFAHDGEDVGLERLADIAVELNLIPPKVLGLARLQAVQSILVTTGIVVHRSGRLQFIHYSFRSYLRALNLARTVSPTANNVWNLVSPFREDWDCVTFVCEIWLREGKDVSAALTGLLAFAEPGMRTISGLASRFSRLPRSVIEAAVAKWMYRDDDFWDAGYLDGPVQQVTLIAWNYEEGRDALRRIAANEDDYWEDSIHAARGLAEIGLMAEASKFLVDCVENVDAYCMDRVLAAQILFEVGAIDEARRCLDLLASEWKLSPPDMALAEIDLGKAFVESGRRQAGLSMLKRLSHDLVDAFDLEVLAETYVKLGLPKRAVGLARAVFRTMEWRRELSGEYRTKAMSLLALLDDVGLKKEATLVRKSISEANEIDHDSLVRTATNARESASRRLASAKKLLNEGAYALASEALELLASDWRIPSYERFSAIDLMMEIAGGRKNAIDLLKRVAEDEPGLRVDCGKNLVLAGELEAGRSILQRIALEPAESVEARVNAICEIASVGQLEIAAAGFRKLCASRAITAPGLSRLAETFAHTSFWSGFLHGCEQLSEISRSTAVRIRAIEIMRRSGWGARRLNHSEFLRRVLLDTDESVEDRINAADELAEHQGEFDVDMLFDIATSPAESVEMGIAAMNALYFKGAHFAALDGGHDVVWDKKLSEDQFIQAAHHFLQRNFDEGELEAEIKAAIAEALVAIVSDGSKPFERRLAAAGVKFENKWSSLDCPFWQGIHTLVCDDGTPIELRWCVILYAVERNPALVTKYAELLKSEDLSAFQKAEVYRAAKNFEVAAKFYREALQSARDVDARIRIVSRFPDLLKEEPAKGLARAVLVESVQQDGHERIDIGAIAHLLLSEGYLSKDERLDVAFSLVSSGHAHAFDVTSALEVVADLAGESEVQRVLRERVDRCSAEGFRELSVFFEVLHLRFLQAKFGARDEAAQALVALSSRKDMDLAWRLQACRWLKAIGRTRDAQACLRKCQTASLGAEEGLSIAEVGIHLHDWSFVRSHLRTMAADGLLSPSTRIRIARELGRAGFPEQGRSLLAGLDLADPEVVSLSIGALVTCGAEDQGLELCQNHSIRPDVESLDRVEVAYQARDCGRNDIARSLLKEIARCGRADLPAASRAAELLAEMGSQTEARAILFALKDQVCQSSILDPDDTMWLVDAMISCDLPVSARAVLDNISRGKLSEDSSARYEELMADLREPQYLLVKFESQ